MDERHGQLKDKAGLDESRINEEFRDFLVKWGPRLLIIVALVALAFSGRRYLNQKADERTDEAFVQLALATGSDATSPDTLLSLARQYDDVGAVPHVARLTAGEAYLAAVRRGVVIGAQPGPTGEFPAEELLDDELRTSYLGQARQAFQQVVDALDVGSGADIHLVRAHMGLAAVAEAMGEIDQARTHYQRAATIDRDAGYGAMAQLAEARLNSLEALATRTSLPSTAQLPQPETPDAGERDEDDPFGLGGLDLGGFGGGSGTGEGEGSGMDTPLGGGLFDPPADEPASEPTPDPEPADPPQDPGQ